LTFNNLSISNLNLPKNDHGYLLIIEGILPYNTTEGQILVDVKSS